MGNEIIVRDVPFTLPNASGAFTITDTGGPAGMTPKACIIVLSGASGTGGETNPARISIGLTDGAAAIAIGLMAEHNVLATLADTGRRRANNKILNLPVTTTEALGVGATFTSVGVNALTINVDTASVLKGFVRFMYGANLSAKLVTVSSPTTDNTAFNSPSLGLVADAVLAISARTVWNTDAGLNNVIFSMGFAGRLPSTSQACVGICAQDLASPTSVGMKARNDRLLSIVISTAGVVTEAISIQLTAWNADDVELTTRDTAGEAIGVGLLAFSLNGERCVADLPALNSDTLGVSSYAGAGFKARALFTVGSAAATANTLDATVGAMSFGVYAPATGSAGGSMAKWNSADAQTTSVTTCSIASDQFHHVESKWAARVVAITVTGFDYNVLVSASADLPTLCFSFGEDPIAPTPAVLALVLPAPTILRTETPAAVPLALALPQPARLLTETPAAVVLALALPQPARLLTETPAAVELALVLPAPTILLENGATPAAVELDLVLPAPAVIVPTAQSPSPVDLALALPQPARLLTETPAAVPLLLALPVVSIVTTAGDLTPAPVALLLALPAPSFLLVDVRLDLVAEIARTLKLGAETPRALDLLAAVE